MGTSNSRKASPTMRPSALVAGGSAVGKVRFMENPRAEATFAVPSRDSLG